MLRVKDEKIDKAEGINSALIFIVFLVLGALGYFMTINNPGTEIKLLREQIK